MTLDQNGARDVLLSYSDESYSGFLRFNSTEPQTIDCWAEFFDVLARDMYPVQSDPDGAIDAFRASAPGMSMAAPIFLGAVNAWVSFIAANQETEIGFKEWSPVAIPFFGPLDFSSPAFLSPTTTPLQVADYVSSQCFAKMSAGISQHTDIALDIVVQANWM